MHTFYQEHMALGCRVQLALVAPATENVVPLFQKLWLEILVFEKRCSRFLPGSELSQFNRTAGQPQVVTPELRDVLVAARQMGSMTRGLYNPFILPALQRTGYDHSLVAGYEQDYVDDHSTKSVVPVDRLEIGETTASIPYGTALDLGGCGKGYIGDVIAELARQWPQLQGFWFSIGGDTITCGTNEQGSNWVVYLQPDPKGGHRIGEVAVPGPDLFAVATSAIHFRQGISNGKRWHHIIDPRTGQAAQSDVTLATVCGSSLLVADVYASCLIIAGSKALGSLVADAAVSSAAWMVEQDPSVQTFGKDVAVYAT